MNNLDKRDDNVLSLSAQGYRMKLKVIIFKYIMLWKKNERKYVVLLLTT